MEIKSLEIKNIACGNFSSDHAGIRHRKTLPCLSVVQSLCGRYEISLGGAEPQLTEEGGAFVAPAGVSQNILHHNGADGYMKAQWVFMNIIVNDVFAFEDVFDIPTLISAERGEGLDALLRAVRQEKNICKKYAAAYAIVDILIAVSTPKGSEPYDQTARLKRYIDEHYSEQITKEELAAVVLCSVPNLYRIFQKYMHMSPRNYINKIRLEKASVLLENDGYPISAVAERVGFDDPVYFSKLFKEQYRLSPKKYRESLRSAPR